MPATPHNKDAPIVKQFAFTGEWVPNLDPSKIGEDNFAMLRNFRYIDGGIAPIEGLTLLTTNKVSGVYTYAGSIIQLETAFTSYIVGHFYNEAKTASRIYSRDTEIPDTGDWTELPEYICATSGYGSRMAQLPRGVGICNNVESLIWEGQKAFPGAVFRMNGLTNLTPTNPSNETEILRNSWTDANNRMVIGSGYTIFTVHTTRPIRAVYVDVYSAATNAGSMISGFYWRGTGWSGMVVDDGTRRTGGSLRGDGWLDWSESYDEINEYIVPAYFEGTHLYMYQFITENCTSWITAMYVDMPCQTIRDIWDGVYRTCIACEVAHDGDNPEDFLVEVNEPSNAEYPIGAWIGGLTDSGYIDIAFEERTAAVLVEMIASYENTAASVLTISYWNGSSYTSVGTVYDGTASDDGTITLHRTGSVSWNPPDDWREVPRNKQGVYGYFYRLTVSADLSGGSSYDTQIDLISGVPVGKTMGAHKFPAMYGNRPFWGCDTMGNELNALDYGPANTVDVYNGQQSSDRGQRIYVGDQSALTGAATLYNRFGSSIYETMLIFKHTSTHLLYGTGPADYRLYNISENYGCPAPKTIASAEIGYEMGGGAYRNICMWLSYRGPVIFDGASMIPIPGVDLYFDSRKTDTYINTDLIESFIGWFDPFWKEYHLLMAIGSNTYLDTHIVYDLTRKKWFEIYYDGGLQHVPQAVCIAKNSTGSLHTLAHMKTGLLYQYGNGNDWDGTTILSRVKTADLMPSESIWAESKMQAVKVGHEIPDFTLTLSSITIGVNYYGDGDAAAVALDDIVIAASDYTTTLILHEETGFEVALLCEDSDYLEYDYVTPYRYIHRTQHMNRVGLTHQFEFYRESDSLGYVGNFGKNLLWWGYLATIDGMELR